MKTEILRDAGYKYDFDRDLFVNRLAKKAFSLEFVDDHPEEELHQGIEERINENEWKFYFNILPSESVRQELERELESLQG